MQDRDAEEETSFQKHQDQAKGQQSSQQLWYRFHSILIICYEEDVLMFKQTGKVSWRNSK
jgi:hypothetical protein